MSLLDQLESGVKNGEISSPFSTDDFKKWIIKYNITNDGEPYALSTIESTLSSSYQNSSSTKTDKKLRLLPNTDPHQYEFI